MEKDRWYDMDDVWDEEWDVLLEGVSTEGIGNDEE